MCVDCWISAGSPAIVNEKTNEVARLIGQLYELPDGGAGGYAHVVLDDWNLDDGDIEFCLKAAKANELGNPELATACIQILEAFKTLDENERVSVMAIQWGLIK